MYYYTYAFLREDKSPYYIGKGKDNRAYRRRNKGEIKPPKDKSRILILKQNLTEEEAFRHEVYMIAVFGRKDLGTGILHNRTDGGEGSSGIMKSEEQKRKQSELMKGRFLGKNHPQYGKKGINSHNYGKLHSEEHRKKNSEAKKGKIPWNKGKSPSEETRRKLSEAIKGKFEGENHPQYGKRGINCPNYGKKRSEETKRKQSEVKKGKNNPAYGKKWWNDGCGNVKISAECPGEGWVLGRGKIKKSQVV